ncbi:MAG: NAD-dependent dehydratase, partial [Candidatus Micrarchaeales archaeon]
DIEIERKGRKSKLPFPRVGGSYYHLSKIFDSYNVALANKAFGITATDIMQGVVFGTKTDEITNDDLATRFDFDSIWGTVLNKYIVQTVLLNKLLIYGKGLMTRGMLSLYDSINCMTLLIDNPAEKGDYRIVNQIDDVYNTVELAKLVQKIAGEFGMSPEFETVEDPRVEKEQHFFEVEHKILPGLGFKRRKSMEEIIREMFEAVIKHKERAKLLEYLIYPTVYWKESTALAHGTFKLPDELYKYGGMV